MKYTLLNKKSKNITEVEKNSTIKELYTYCRNYDILYDLKRK